MTAGDEVCRPIRPGNIGEFGDVNVSPDGKLVSDEEWVKREAEWLPSDEDHAFVQSLMQAPVTEPGKYAAWIAPPARGIDSKPVDFEYVKMN